VKFQGTVVEHPEMHFTSSGKAICNFYVDTEDERLTVVTWQDLAEKVAQHVLPEDRVEIYGTKKVRWWTTPEGDKHSREELNANRVKVVARPTYPDYCCLSCIHWEADCLRGCYSAFGSAKDREICEVVDNKCMNTDTETRELMNRDCWEKK